MIERAIELLGLAVLARELGVTPQAVHKWRSSRVPAERCAAIERATSGSVTRYHLRPDVFGEPPQPESPAPDVEPVGDVDAAKAAA